MIVSGGPSVLQGPTLCPVYGCYAEHHGNKQACTAGQQLSSYVRSPDLTGRRLQCTQRSENALIDLKRSEAPRHVQQRQTGLTAQLGEQHVRKVKMN